MRLLATLLCLAAAGCSDSAVGPKPTGNDLEDAAFDAGIIADPQHVMLTGLYERPSDIGTDRFCALADGEASPGRGDYRIGLVTVSGAESFCEAHGTARHDGETLRITLAGADGESCAFEAGFDGEQIAIPGKLADGCKAFCTGRANFAGVTLALTESSEAAALRPRSSDKQPLCTE